MTDRELLELAAKAAGMNVLERPWNDDDGWFFCEQHGNPAMHFRKFDNPHHCSNSWKPLTDDGDALRLACKVGLRINTAYKTGKDERPGVGIWIPGDQEHYPPFWEANSIDHCAAVRGTIVRAAAEIGKSMK